MRARIGPTPRRLIDFSPTATSAKSRSWLGISKLPLKHITVRGILMHSSLAITPEGAAVGIGGHQVLDPQTIQGIQCPEEEDQSNTGADRREGKHPLAAEPATIHGTHKQSR